MGLRVRLSKEEFETKADVRAEVAKRFPLHALAGIIDASSKDTDDPEWEVALEGGPNRKKPARRAAKPFPLDGLGDDDKAEDEESADSKDLSDEKEDKSKKDKKEDSKDEDKDDGDKEADLPKLLNQLKGILERIEKTVGGAEVSPVDPLDGPDSEGLLPPKAPKPKPEPTAEDIGPVPGGPDVGGGPGLPPGPRTPRKKPAPIGIPTFTSVRNTIIKECSTEISQEDALGAFEAEYPDYEIAEMRMVGDRWVVKAQLREESNATEGVSS